MVSWPRPAPPAAYLLHVTIRQTPQLTAVGQMSAVPVLSVYLTQSNHKLPPYTAGSRQDVLSVVRCVGRGAGTGACVPRPSALWLVS